MNTLYVLSPDRTDAARRGQTCAERGLAEQTFYDQFGDSSTVSILRFVTRVEGLCTWLATLGIDGGRDKASRKHPIEHVNPHEHLHLTRTHD